MCEKFYIHYGGCQLKGSLYISFSERRFSLGCVYAFSGFLKVDQTLPSYWWSRKLERRHRRGFQHKFLKSKLEVYDPDKTEVENCHNNGYYRIWDCGLDKWQKLISSN